LSGRAPRTGWDRISLGNMQLGFYAGTRTPERNSLEDNSNFGTTTTAAEQQVASRRKTFRSRRENADAIEFIGAIPGGVRDQRIAIRN